MPGPEWKKTACNICYVNCGVEVLVDDGKITKVRGDRDNPKSQGYLCNKAARIPWYAHHRDRLTSPLRRRPDGGFDEIDWDTAIAEIAARVRDLVERHGGKSLALYGGGGQGNHAGGASAHGFPRCVGFASRLQCAVAEEARRLLDHRPHVRQPALPYRRGRASLRPAV